jgi:hypothetical protein
MLGLSPGLQHHAGNIMAREPRKSRKIHPRGAALQLHGLAAMQRIDSDTIFRLHLI